MVAKDSSIKKEKRSKMKGVSFRMHDEKGVQEFVDEKSIIDYHSADNDRHKLWYTQQELDVFKHQARVETKKFRHACYKYDKMKATSLFEPWSNSLVEMKTILLSALDNHKLSSADTMPPKTRDTLTISRGLESRIFYQHQQKKILATREILKYHKRSLALIQEASKTMHPDCIKRLRRVSAYRLASLSSKCSSWARQVSLKSAQLDRASVISYYKKSNPSSTCSSPSTIMSVLQEKSQLDQLTDSIKRKRCSKEEASPVVKQTIKRARRNALSFRN